ncbi:MAG: hypothetical protein JRF25_07060 [Deltaproteobacteria bacterium]|nr:hypothetical protein [Deltaproteobacteria bacterium]
MSERVKWIEHKGEKILFADLSNTKTMEEVQEVLDIVFEAAKTVPEGILRYITNMDQAYVSAKTMPLYREAAAKIKPYLKKWSMFGLSKINVMILKVLQKSLGLDAQPFTNQEEALDYLVS